MSVWLVALLAGMAGPGQPRPTPGAFRPGESLSYSVSLLGVRTAEADLRVEEEGDDQLRLMARGRTVGAADSLLALRQSASCIVDSSNLEPSLCRFQSDRRGTERRREIRFDAASHSVRERTLEGGKHEESSVAFDGEMGDVQEALSGFYWLRTVVPAPGESIKMRAVSKGKPVSVEARGLRPEEITTPAGTFRAVVVQLHIAGAQKDQAKDGIIWFSDDARHLPVRISVDAPVGSLVAELTSASGTVDPGMAKR